METPSQNIPPKFEELYVFIVTKKDGSEGVAGFHENFVMLPLIAADEETMIEMYKIASRIALSIEDEGDTIRLVKFHNKEELGGV
jgi:hypothetical protein